MASIFISHSNLDSEFAAEMKSWLAAQGYERVFLDFDKHTGFHAGENWEQRLYEEISRCHAILLILTPNWQASKWCFAEFTQARALGKIIFPIVRSPLGPALIVPEIQNVDVREWDEAGQEQLRNRIRAVTDEIARGFPWTGVRPPYPGINSFEKEDAAVFFGRDQEIRETIERLEARRIQGGKRLLLVLGASGSGKSSLLKAGVLPQLERDRKNWVVLPPFRPEREPVTELAKAIAEAVGRPSEWKSWRDALQGDDPVTALRAIADELRIGSARGATMLVVIDQFEEVLTVALPLQLQSFLHILGTAVGTEHALPFLAVATMRSDVFGEILRLPTFTLQFEPYSLRPMPLDRVHRLIEGPAAVAGLAVEKGFSERVSRDVSTSDALPLLAFALRDVYERFGSQRRLAIRDYEALGDQAAALSPLEAAVKRRAQDVLDTARPSEEELAALREAFVPGLVRVSEEATFVRQPALLADLPTRAHRLLDALSSPAARLLTKRADARTGEATIEVAHEALFRAWPLLAQWLIEEKEFLIGMRQIEEAQLLWRKAEGTEKETALLHGLMLSRAKQWLAAHPQRLAKVSQFVGSSIAADDAERARDERERQQKAKLQRRLTLVSVVAAIAAVGNAVFFANAAWRSQSELADVVGQQEAAAAKERAELSQRDAEVARQEARAAAEQAQLAREREAAALARAKFGDEVLRQQSAALTGEAREALKSKQIQVALDKAIKALPDPENKIERPPSPEAEAVLFAALQALPRPMLSLSIPNEATRSGSIMLKTDASGAVRFSPDGALAASFGMDSKVRLINVESGEVVRSLDGHLAAFSPEGRRLAVANGSNVQIVDITMGASTALAFDGGNHVESLAFAADGSKIGIAYTQNFADILDARSAAKIATLEQPVGLRIHKLVFSPDGNRVLAIGTSLYTARLFDSHSGKEIAVLRGHRGLSPYGLIETGGFSPDSKRAITGAADGTARLWDIRGRDAGVLDHARFTERITQAQFSPSNPDQVLTGASDGAARLWSANSPRQPLKVLDIGGQIVAAQFSGDGSRFLAAGALGRASIFSAQGDEIVTFRSGRATLIGAALSSNGRKVITATAEGLVQVWQDETRSEHAILPFQGEVSALSFGSDNRLSVTKPGASASVVIDVPPPSSAASKPITDSAPTATGTLPEATRSIEIMKDGQAAIIDRTEQKEVARLKPSANCTLSSPVLNGDGTLAAAACSDGTIRLWHIYPSTHAIVNEARAVLAGLQGSAR